MGRTKRVKAVKYMVMEGDQAPGGKYYCAVKLYTWNSDQVINQCYQINLIFFKKKLLKPLEFTK